MVYYKYNVDTIPGSWQYLEIILMRLSNRFLSDDISVGSYDVFDSSSSFLIVLMEITPCDVSGLSKCIQNNDLKHCCKLDK